jgi:hypothetical protein
LVGLTDHATRGIFELIGDVALTTTNVKSLTTWLHIREACNGNM